MEELTDHYWLPPGTDYMRWMDDGKVTRVAKAQGGLVLALYPSENSDVFYGEAFREIDDNSPKREIGREEIKDKLWLKLLDGESKEAIFEAIEEVREGSQAAPLF